MAMALSKDLPNDWEVRFDKKEGRNLFINHRTKTSTWIDPRERKMTSTKGLPYGWEVAYDTSVGPYMIDHTTWKTYLPEEVPEHWLAYLNAKAGRSGRLSPRKRQKKVGNTGVRSSTPNRRQTLRRRNSQTMPSSGFHQTMSGIAENNILVGKLMKQIEGKLMKQMDVLHTELVKSRTDQTIASSKERQTVTAAVRSATKELDKLATARAKAEAKSMQDKLKFATRKTRATSRSAVAAKCRENLQTSPQNGNSVGPKVAIGKTRAFELKV